jgi:hypothetical protein
MAPSKTQTPAPVSQESRLVVLDYFDTGDPEKFAAEYDLSGHRAVYDGDGITSQRNTVI